MSGSQRGSAGDAIRVAVFGPRRLISESLAATLRAQPGFELVPPRSHDVPAGDVDVVVLLRERSMDDQPVPAGLAARPRVLIAPFHDRAEIAAAIESGARACVSRDAAVPELLAAIRSAHEGVGYLCPIVADLVCRPAADSRGDGGRTRSLTQREQDVLELLAQGFSNPEIARLRNLSVKTVHTHRQNIMTKLGVRGAAALMRRAIQLGLVAA